MMGEVGLETDLHARLVILYAKTKLVLREFLRMYK